MHSSPFAIGYLAQVACTWEVLARKAGNVCPGREYPDLTVNDFLASAAAIAPVMEQAPWHPIGVTVLRAIEATRQVVATNTNLGIVLLLAPLASIPLDRPLAPALHYRLEHLTVEDSRLVYEAIRLANPSGLGQAKEQDIRDEPTLPLRQAMALAEDDLIAIQYASDFDLILNQLVPVLCRLAEMLKNVERAVVETQIRLLRFYLDSHVFRKLGLSEAESVRDKARLVGNLSTKRSRQSFREFDAFLRADNHARNPGTTADLLAACLFVALREKAISLSTQFVWEEHPFAHDDSEKGQ